MLDFILHLFHAMRHLIMTTTAATTGLALPGYAMPLHTEAQINTAALSPTLGSVTIIANVTDPSVDRDSCGSCTFGDRTFWTCRDTMGWNNTAKSALLPIVSNTASWTNMTSTGPALHTGVPAGAGSDGDNPVLLMYGDNVETQLSFFPLSADECPYNGECADGSRWALWPDSPPLVTNTYDNGTAVAYTWIRKLHLYDGLTQLNPNPAFTLFKITYTPSDNIDQMPSVEIVNENFWDSNHIGYGDYGNLVANGTAYLYGQTGQGATTLASVPVNSVEDISAYQYYVNGTWTKQMPGLNDTSAALANAGAGGQGTFFYDKYLKSYVWVGQGNIDTQAHAVVSTAPEPWGPWIEPYQLWQAPLTSGSYGYSLQVNPALKPANDTSNGFYLTWTNWNAGLYTTPLAYITWAT